MSYQRIGKSKQKKLKIKKDVLYNIIKTCNSITNANLIKTNSQERFQSNINNDINNIVSFIKNNYKSPEYIMDLSIDDIITSINTTLITKYIDKLNCLVVSSKIKLIVDVLNELNIDTGVDMSGRGFLNKLVLQRIKLEQYIKKNKLIAEEIKLTVDPKKRQENYIKNTNEYNKLNLQNMFISCIIDYTDIKFKKYKHLDRTVFINDEKIGRENEILVNNNLINLLNSYIKTGQVHRDILYITNLNYKMLTSNKICNSKNKFKQEIDGLLFIKTDSGKWTPFMIIEIKKNINLIYSDISKLDGLYDRLCVIDNCSITINNIDYEIDTSGFKTCKLFYYVSDINKFYDNNIIKFVDDNYFSKSIIFDTTIDEIIKKIDSIENFTNVMDLDDYIINILEHNSYDTQKLLENNNKYKTIRDDLYMRLKYINDTNSSLYIEPDRETFNIYDYKFFNIDGDVFTYLKNKNILNETIINIMLIKYNQNKTIFENFINRPNTRINMLPCLSKVTIF